MFRIEQIIIKILYNSDFYDVLANELSQIYKCKSKIIPFVITWDGVVTKYHKQHIKDLEISKNAQAYIQTKIIKKTLESISFEYRRELQEDNDNINSLLE